MQKNQLYSLAAISVVVLALAGLVLWHSAPSLQPPIELVDSAPDFSAQNSPLLPIDAALAAQLVPHRALYEMKLVSSKAQSSVNNASGKMLFAWADTCDGWTLEQRLDLDFTYTQGETQSIKTSFATWEAKDGSQFVFNVRRAVNGTEKEQFRGQAQFATGSAAADYLLPEEKTLPLPPQTILPTRHSIALLQAALAGQKFVTQTVFDGSDEVGLNQISAVIGAGQPVTAAAEMANGALASGTAYPVQLAFYEPDNTSGLPDYEMRLLLLANGIARDLLIDYGDFAVRATLQSIEPIAKPDC